MDTSRSLLPVGAAAAVVGLLILIPVMLMMLDDQPTPAANTGCIPAGGSATGIPEQYRQDVTAAATEAGVPAALVAAQIQTESGWDPHARSPVGARGIAQFMPDTWDEYGQGADPLDPQAGIAALGRYLKAIRTQVQHLGATEAERIDLTLAAYNAGPGSVQEHNGIPPFPETQDYVRKINDLAQLNYSADCAPLGGSVIGELGTGEWTHPLPGGILTSRFGYRGCVAGVVCNEYVSTHRGLDLSTGGGATVVAPTDLRVTAAGVNQYQGHYIVGRMTEDPGLVFQFHHCAPGTLQVGQGDTVAAGTPLCVEGSTGNSARAHLHFQINAPEADDTRPTYTHALDPYPILIQKGIAL
ncbi:transglycosylase SLT domain-containing protein [Citricoccus sp. I39-566]|uniref:transglycosylase SLT domain-containing protein n=1 Tax=Citricoccus sp. I39-566 TaxID=3073268 RepID=UPI00286C5772|nr:transglycosylase SLT domain-containing protein [Citricoccus sp. I39-566]WMY79992.1 transglycosylase SLT domain-containing protein [Citricoccus sp. I39-566]